MSYFDDQSIEVACPGCGHENHVQVAVLKTSPTIMCGGCDQGIKLEAADFAESLREADSILDDFGKEVEGFMITKEPSDNEP